MRQLSTPFESHRPPVRVREAATREAVRGADAMATAGRDLIARYGCTMLLIERTVRDGKVSIRIDAIAADGNRTRGIARSGDTAMRQLCQTANVVLRALAHDLPAAADDRVGVMTDGTGIVFSPDRPSTKDDGWLAALLLGTVRAVDLVPFAADGHWCRLALRQGCAALH